MNETKPKRRWFRFSIRDLFWLTVLAAVLVAWSLDHWNLTKQDLSTLVIYSIADADVKTLAATLQQIYSGYPDVRIVADTEQKKIISHAPPRQQAEIEAIALKLDVPAATQ